jgi:hypothetical protein
MPCLPVEPAQANISLVHSLVLPGLSLEGNCKELAYKAAAAVRGNKIPAADGLFASFRF